MYIGFESDTYNIAHNITQIRSGSCLIHAHTMYEILYFIEGDAIFSLAVRNTGWSPIPCC